MTFPMFGSTLALAYDASFTAVDGLSEDEARIATHLAGGLFDRRQVLTQSRAYYDGLQPVTNLGISTPPELVSLRSVIGWCQTAIDAIVERQQIQGFRLQNSTAASDELWQIFQANNLPAESPLVHLDSRIYGCAYAVVGGTRGNMPIITCESPVDLYASQDPHTRSTTGAYQAYIDVDPVSETYAQQLATLYLPNVTIHMVNDIRGWSIIERDDHRFGAVPVVAFPNRQTTHLRQGLSEITSAWRNTVDRACRTMVAMEVQREFFSMPHYFGLGMAEDAFVAADGSKRTAFQAAANAFNLFEADEMGNLPQIGSLPANDPSSLTKLFELDVRIMSQLTGLPPQYLGIISDGNPASADAIHANDDRLVRKTFAKCVSDGDAWERVMRLALLARDGSVPEEMDRLETDWGPMGIPTPAADTDALQKQIAAGMVPPTADDVLARGGWSAVERSRLADERRRTQGQQNLTALLAAAKPQPPQQQPSPTPPAGNGNQPTG